MTFWIACIRLQVNLRVRLAAENKSAVRKFNLRLLACKTDAIIVRTVWPGFYSMQLLCFQATEPIKKGQVTRVRYYLLNLY